MKKFIFNLLIILIFISGCQTIKKKSDEVAEKKMKDMVNLLENKLLI